MNDLIDEETKATADEILNKIRGLGEEQTAKTPGYTFCNDNNTDIGSRSTDELELIAGGVPALVFKDLEPAVGDLYEDTDTGKVMAYDGEKWVKTESTPQPICEFNADTWEFNADELVDPVFTIEPTHRITIHNGTDTIVEMCTKTGKVTFGENYTFDEASRIFYQCLAASNPQTQEIKELNLAPQSGAAHEILRTVRHNLGVPEGDDIIEFTKKHSDGCAWYGWDHQFSFSDSDCTCFKIEVLEGGIPLKAGMEDIQYFQDKLARAMRLGQPTKKIETQLEFAEDSVSIYDREFLSRVPKHLKNIRAEKVFDDAMKVID